MEPDILQQYEHYFEMFLTEGWKQFVEDMQSVHDSYEIENIKDETTLFYIKGERRVLKQIIQFEDSIRHSYDSLVENDA